MQQAKYVFYVSAEGSWRALSCSGSEIAVSAAITVNASELLGSACEVSSVRPREHSSRLLEEATRTEVQNMC
ncbi:unnamed protein product [Musa acuminata subsp. burmannicoides]